MPDYVIRPDYSSDEYSDYGDDFGYEFAPRARTTYKPPEKDYKTKLYESTIYDKPDEFIQLLSNNAEKTDFDYDGWTLLMVAASHGQFEKMKHLINLGLDVNFNYNSFTPLLAVCDSTKQETELVKCLQLLEQSGAQFDIEDRHGVTPLMYAIKNGHVNIVKYLIKKCFDSLNKTDSESQSALFYAVIHNRADIVELLLEANVATNVVDLLGRTAFDIAVLKNPEIAEILQPGYLAQQEQELLAVHEDRSNYTTYDYITLFRSNLPSDDIEQTGFYTNVIEILNACYLLDFSSTMIENQTSLFQLINSNDNFLKTNNIHLSYQRNDILKSIKLFNLQKWKLSRSIVNKTASKTIKMDEFTHYIYLICEQLYVNYSAFNYVEKNNFQLTDIKKKCDMDYFKTLVRLSAILNKYERFVEKEILQHNCLHLPGYIEGGSREISVQTVLSCAATVLTLGITYYYFRK